jgi:hypothetical protein
VKCTGKAIQAILDRTSRLFTNDQDQFPAHLKGKKNSDFILQKKWPVIVTKISVQKNVNFI